MTDNQPTKRCPKCGEEKPISCFPLRRRGGKVYPHSQCKQCRNEYLRRRRAQYRAAHPKPVLAPSMKRCALCGEVFPIEMMGTCTSRGKVYVGSWCPVCTKIRRKQSSEAYNARQRQLTAERRAANAPKEGHLRCCHCGQEKPMEEFRRESRSATGYRNMCLECARKYSRERYKRCKKTRKGVFFDSNVGRLMDHRASSISIYWTENMLSILRRYYPNTSNAEVSEMTGVCKATVIKKARELGLCKSKEYIRNLHKQCGLLGAVANNKRIKEQQSPINL